MTRGGVGWGLVGTIHDDGMARFSTLQSLCDGNPEDSSPWYSPHKGPEMRNFDVSFAVNPYKLLNKQSSRRWNETPWSSCDAIVMICIELQQVRQDHTKSYWPSLSVSHPNWMGIRSAQQCLSQWGCYVKGIFSFEKVLPRHERISFGCKD